MCELSQPCWVIALTLEPSNDRFKFGIIFKFSILRIIQMLSYVNWKFKATFLVYLSKI